MRALWPALALIVVAAACAPAANEATTTLPAGTTSSTNSVATTIRDTREVTLMIDDSEAVAVDRGVRLEVRDDTGSLLGWLDGDHPRLDVDAATGKVTVRYATADGGPGGVIWEQDLAGSVTRVRQPWRGRHECFVTLPDGSSANVALVWQSAGDTASYTEQLLRTGDAVTVVSPVWWRLAADGTLSSTADPDYVETVHDRNVAIWPAVAGFEADAIHLAVANPEERTKLAVEISEEAKAIGADGVNIDLEGYRPGDAEAFVAWVAELAELVVGWGGRVSHDVVPRSDKWDVEPSELSFWSTAPLRSELSDITDCTVLMAYDQYNRHRPAGPVASPTWVEDVLTHELRHADPAELVLGMPFYGRIWDPSDLSHPRAVGIGDMEALVSAGEASFDNRQQLDRVELPDGRFFWAETTEQLERRLQLVDSHGLAGWAAWRLGFDHPEIWELVDTSD